jgi:hypothetical protein
VFGGNTQHTFNTTSFKYFERVHLTLLLLVLASTLSREQSGEIVRTDAPVFQCEEAALLPIPAPNASCPARHAASALDCHSAEETEISQES